ncbi:hypothetical protein ACFL6U_09130 [Planctomycetota bacterium]
MLTRILVTTVLLTSTAAALTSMGPPTTKMQKGQVAFSSLINWSVNDVVDTTGGVKTYYNNIILESALAGLHVGLDSDRVELYGLLGGGGIANSGLAVDSEDVWTSSMRISGGGGLRVTTNLGGSLSWGFVAQTVYYTDDIVEGFDTQLALGPCWRPRMGKRTQNTALLYGGPMFHFINGTGRKDYVYSLRERDWFGLYIGGGVEVFEGKMTLAIEEQVTASAYGGSLYIKLRF